MGGSLYTQSQSGLPSETVSKERERKTQIVVACDGTWIGTLRQEELKFQASLDYNAVSLKRPHLEYMHMVLVRVSLTVSRSNLGRG